MSKNENVSKSVWRFRVLPAVVGSFWLLIGFLVAASPRIAPKILNPNYILAWMIMFGFPCLILFRISFYRAKISAEPPIKPPAQSPQIPQEARESKRRKIEEALQDGFQDWHPRDFEKLVAELFRRMGYVARLTPYQRDYGADILLKKDNRNIIVQVKKYPQDHLVEYEEVRDTVGAIPHFRADKAIFITSSDFTERAIAYAREKHIELWNFQTLKELVEKYFVKTALVTTSKKEEQESAEEEIATDAYKEAYPELSEEEAELQETQEVDMDLDDEENDPDNTTHISRDKVEVKQAYFLPIKVIRKCRICGHEISDLEYKKHNGLCHTCWKWRHPDEIPGPNRDGIHEARRAGLLGADRAGTW